MVERLRLGQIVNVVGLKGECKVYPYTDEKERFEELPQMFLEDETVVVERVRYAGKMVVIKLQGVDDRTTAEKLKGKFLYVDRQHARPLEDGEYWIPDLVGLRVEDEEGKEWGMLVHVWDNTAQDVYEVEMPSGKRFLIPAVKEFVREVDVKNGVMKVALIEGMVDDEN